MGEFLEQSGSILLLWRFVQEGVLAGLLCKFMGPQNPDYLNVIQLSQFPCTHLWNYTCKAHLWSNGLKDPASEYPLLFALGHWAQNALSSRYCLPCCGLYHTGLVMCHLSPPVVFRVWVTPNHIVLLWILSTHRVFLFVCLFACFYLSHSVWICWGIWGHLIVMPAPLPSQMGSNMHLSWGARPQQRWVFRWFPVFCYYKKCIKIFWKYISTHWVFFL